MALLKILKGLNIPIKMFRLSQEAYERGIIDIKYFDLSEGIKKCNIDEYLEDTWLKIGKYRTLYELNSEPDQEYLDNICYFVAIKEYLIEYKNRV